MSFKVSRLKKNMFIKVIFLFLVSIGFLILQYQLLTFDDQPIYLPLSRKGNVGSLKSENASKIPKIYIITPTHRRPEQIAVLTRLSHTLMLVPDIIWLVIEDSSETSDILEEVLLKSGIRFCYMCAPTLESIRGPVSVNMRRTFLRNKGIEWIRENAKTGILYLADENYVYDLELFSEIRKTKKISMFPVGLLLPKVSLKTPMVVNCTFIGFYNETVDYESRFSVNFAGFAIAVDFLLQRPYAKIPYIPFYDADWFLRGLLPFKFKEIELLASCCTKILVWYTRMRTSAPAQEIPIKYIDTNLVVLKKRLG